MLKNTNNLIKLTLNIKTNKILKRFNSSYININNIKQEVITRKYFDITKCKNILKNDTIAILGYGPQGRAQSLNLRDNKFNTILGLRKDGKSWDNALKDNWIPDVNLFDLNEATSKGTIIKYLLSDAGQIEQWKNVKENLYTNDTLYFSHGFGIHYHKYTNINPPEDINVIMVSPKCSGNTVRKHFENQKGFTSSYAVYKDYDDRAHDISKALAFSIGSNYIFETTFENEVISDLTGERCVLMGLIQAAFSAQYKVLINNGHTPLEAYNETVEEALKSLYPLIDDKGMDWLYENCSTTAQRGALDWSKKFEPKLISMITECYNSVKDESEVKRLIECNKDSDYNSKLKKELDYLSKHDLWYIKKQIDRINKKSSSDTWDGFLL